MNNVAKNALSINNIMRFTSAKIDHIIFKNSVYGAVMKEQYVEMPDHNTCNFGKWYNKEIKEKFGTLESFKQIDPFHARVHDAAKKNLEIIKTQKINSENKNEIIQNFTVMEEASASLFELIDKTI